MKNIIYIFKINFLILIVLFSLFSISRVEASEPTFDWAKQLVGADGDSYNWPGMPQSITKDSDGNIYVAGMFEGTVDFDPGDGTANLTSAGSYDTYILKLNSNGEYIWAKSVGGTGDDQGISLSLDSNGNVYVIGEFYGTVDFDPGDGTANLTSAGSYDTYILKLNSNGEYIWAKSVGGTGDDYGNSLSLDSNGNVYVIGEFYGTVDFDPGDGTANLTSAGSLDTYILKLNSNGEYIWAKSVGGTGDDRGLSLSLDSNGNVYVTGRFYDTVDFDPGDGTANLTSAGSYDTYILKLNSNGEYIWAKSVGGTGDDQGISLSLDSNGNVYVIGEFYGTVDFDPGDGTANLTSAGSYDTYILKLNSNGEYIWAKSVGGTGDDQGISLSLDSNGNVYVIGEFYGTVDFDPSDGTVELTAGSGGDSYILKLDPNGNYLWAGDINGGDEGNYSYSIYIDSDNNIFVAGEIYGISDMDPGTEVYNLDATVSTDDSFILKLSQTPPVTPPVPHTSHTTSSGYASPAMLATFQAEQQARAKAVGIPWPITQTVNQIETLTNTETTPTITRTLKYKMTGEEVKQLQVYLNTHGYIISQTGNGSPNNETTYFGLKTKEAVIKFQVANGMVGDGVVGKITQEKMKSILSVIK